MTPSDRNQNLIQSALTNFQKKRSSKYNILQQNNELLTTVNIIQLKTYKLQYQTFKYHSLRLKIIFQHCFNRFSTKNNR